MQERICPTTGAVHLIPEPGLQPLKQAVTLLKEDTQRLRRLVEALVDVLDDDRFEVFKAIIEERGL